MNAIIAETKLEQLKRGMERKLKEQLLKLENQIAEAEDEAELARTKEEFYDDNFETEINGLDNMFYVSENGSSNANVLRDNNQGVNLSDVNVTTSSQVLTNGLCRSKEVCNLNQHGFVSDANVTTSTQVSTNGLFRFNTGDITYVVHTTTPLCSSREFSHSNQYGFVCGSNANAASCLADQMYHYTSPVMSNVANLSSSMPSAVYTSTLAQPKVHINEHVEVYCPNETDYIKQSNATTSVMEKLTLGIDSILTRSTLPPLDVVKFCGEPQAYYRFKSRFHEMVESQNISELQKRLLQFLDGKAKRAVASYEGVPGGMQIALKVLEQRFGQPHIVAKSCVDALIDGSNIARNDAHALREFADKSRSLYETLKSMDALSEMNMTNLAKMSSKLPISLQAKWRDEAQRIRAKGQPPSVRELVQFIERQADAANDPVFARIGESHKNYPKLHSKVHVPVRKGPSTQVTLSSGSKVVTLTTQVESKSAGQHATPSSKIDDSSESSIKCYICGLSHAIERCPEFTDKSVRQRSVLVRQKGHCMNCLRKGHFAAQCNSKFRCKECKQTHHTLLHKSNEDKVNNETVNL